MILDSFVERVQDDLRSAAALGGPELAQAVDHLALALDASMRLALLQAVGAAAEELSADLAPGSVTVQLDDGAPRLVARIEDSAQAVAPPLSDPDEAGPDDDIARISLRISGALKRKVETAAATEQMSVNNWIARTLAAALHDSARRTASTRRGHVRGWAH